ncbi:glycosyltransferase family 39 protein [Dictyobacter arantiisoli]|uniref:Glycosyltransferase RgtA/B/C/D-like domain-containing protein n=1 Tax=Dictyobacter arantiisoli TaxID=2014874 RepID=A0A5A5TA42_9CHLR|nr:glycosyltransferase family 39 protein [Dictyobacter arantiisoli]GCF08268.1 hypothetical protein KDI_18320 [Dictyobacter arantiisoli]
MKRTIRWQNWILLGLVCLSFGLRVYGLNWDAGQNFHPDEREILFHVTALSWPTSWAQFVNPATSPLNPQFFAYGSFPIYFLALLGYLLRLDLHVATNFVPLTLIGRVVSALFDTGTVFLTGCLGGVLANKTKQLQSYAWGVKLFATALMTFAPLDLQLSHFYTVDTLLVFFVTLTILACVILVDTEKPLRWAALAGLAYGLAMATKISAAPLVAPLLIAVGLRWYQRKEVLEIAVVLCWMAALTILLFFVTQPYALLDMSNFIQQVSEQGSLARGGLDLPYVRQFVGTISFLYQGQNIILWGLGVMLGITSFVGLCWLFWMLCRNIFSPWLIIFSWIVVYGAIVGSFFVKFMRYMLPLYPFLVVVAASFLVVMLHKIRWSRQNYLSSLDWITPLLRIGLLLVVLGGTMFQGLALLNVYSTPNTRIQASNWIYQHIPRGSILTYEQWDDALPVTVGNHNPGEYIQQTYLDASGQPATGLDLYGDDTQAKAQKLATFLTQVNVITMPTDRLDKSIPRSPARYPLTTRYYQLLFSGQLGFHLAATFSNHPHLFGITLDDSNADESYSVFDHPTARIFVRDTHTHYTTLQLVAKLLDGIHVPAQ